MPSSIRRLWLYAGCLAIATQSGCTLTRITSKGVTSYAPAWPWQDSNKSLEKLRLIAGGTNGVDATLSGAKGSEVTSTNATALLESVVSAAVSSAIHAAK